MQTSGAYFGYLGDWLSKLNQQTFTNTLPNTLTPKKAKITKKSSKKGAFLDSTFDKISEVIIGYHSKPVFGITTAEDCETQYYYNIIYVCDLHVTYHGRTKCLKCSRDMTFQQVSSHWNVHSCSKLSLGQFFKGELS